MTYQYNFSMRDLLDAGVHFGHRKNFWNPKMAKYIYGTRNGVHIIDLQNTYPMLKNALNAIKEVAAKNGKVLFVGTKKQASEIIAENAKKCGQYYVNHRWLGGMLTNWSTVSASIKVLQKIEDTLADEAIVLTKKERLDLDRKREKLDKVLGGIRNMGGRPDILFIIDTNLEHISVTEARKLGIPVIAVVDTNSNPDDIDYLIPGNDDARKAIELYTSLAADAALAGMQESLANAGVDVGNIDMSIDLVELSEDIMAPEEEASVESKAKVVKKVSKAKKIEDADKSMAAASIEAEVSAAV